MRSRAVYGGVRWNVPRPVIRGQLLPFALSGQRASSRVEKNLAIW